MDAEEDSNPQATQRDLTDLFAHIEAFHSEYLDVIDSLLPKPDIHSEDPGGNTGHKNHGPTYPQRVNPFSEDDASADPRVRELDDQMLGIEPVDSRVGRKSGGTSFPPLKRTLRRQGVQNNNPNIFRTSQREPISMGVEYSTPPKINTKPKFAKTKDGLEDISE